MTTNYSVDERSEGVLQKQIGVAFGMEAVIRFRVDSGRLEGE